MTEALVVLLEIARYPRASLRDIAFALNWRAATGRLDSRKVHAAVIEASLNGWLACAERGRYGAWKITDKGQHIIRQCD